MCMPSAPDVPTMPERQAQKLPDGGQTAGRVSDNASRRRAMMATILTGGQGVLGAPTVTKLGN